MSREDRVAKVAEDENSTTYEVNVSVGSIAEKTADPAESDIFMSSADDLRKLRGLSPTFKRNASRSMQKYLRGTGGAETKAQPYPYTSPSGYALFDVVSPPYNLDYLAMLYEKSTPHAAAVRAKVKNIVALGYDFVETDATTQALGAAQGNQKKLARMRDKLQTGRQQLLDWIDSCNEEDTFTETLIKVWTDYETTGNAYIEIGRKTNGQIGYIGHIPATSMRVRKQRDGFVQIVANVATFFRHLGDQETENPIGNDPRPNEVIHLKKYTPTNGYYGIPDIIPAMTAVAGNEFAAKFNIDYFENKAVPRYVIILKGANLSTRSQQDILEFFQASVKGKNHRTLYVPLPPDSDGNKVEFEMKPVENGVVDGSFTNYRQGNLNDILMAHGVPVTKTAIATDLALAAAKDLDKTFKEQVCRPEQDILEKKLAKIIKEITSVFELKLSELSLTDEQTQAKIDEVYLRLGTVLPNEVRARQGKPGIPDGDKPAVISPQAQAEAKAQATGNRSRDQQRSQNSTDSASSTNSRNPKGDGRQQS